MKKFFLTLVFVPSFVLASFYYNEDMRVSSVSLFTYTDFDVVPTRQNSPFYIVDSLDQLYSIFSSSSFGFKIRLARTVARGYDYSFVVPSPSSNFFIDQSVPTISNCVVAVTNDVSVKVSPLYFSNIASLYQSAASLFANGYRGPAVNYFSSGNTYCVNVNYPLLLSDVLSSTNTVYRSILLSYLSSISSAVLNIDSSLSSVSSSVENLSSINSFGFSSISNSLSSFSQSLSNVVNDLSVIASNSFSSFSFKNFISNGGLWWEFVDSSSELYNPLFQVAVEYDDSKIRSFVQSLIDTGYDLGFIYDSVVLLKPSFLTSSLLAYSTAVKNSDFSASPLDFYNDVELTYNVISQSQNADIVDALIGDYSDSPTRGGKAVNTRTSIKAQLRSWRDEAKQQLQNWKDDLHQQLQDWKYSDATGFLNVRDRIDNVSSNQVRYLDKDSPDSSINYGVRNLTNAADRIVRDSSFAITNAIDDLRDFFDQNLFGDDAKDIGVRISFPLRYRSSSEVNVHDAEVADAIRNGYININELKTAILEALNTCDPSVRVNGAVSVDQSEWLEEWRRWVDDDTFYELAESFYGFKELWETNALPFFEDYYTSYLWDGNSFYKSAFDIVRYSSHSNILNRLCAYGLSREPNRGNFFDLFTSSVLLQSEVISSFLDVRDLVDDLSSSSSWFDGLSPFSVARRVSDSIPSKSQIEQIISTSTDGTNLVSSSFTDMLDSFSLMTNLHSTAFNVFTSSSSSTLPDSIVLFRLRTKSLNSASSYRDVRIPVGTIPDVWLIVRLSVAFGICAVNLILFPKFLLKLALLFMPLFKRSLPFLSAVT